MEKNARNIRVSSFGTWLVRGSSLVSNRSPVFWNYPFEQVTPEETYGIQNDIDTIKGTRVCRFLLFISTVIYYFSWGCNFDV